MEVPQVKPANNSDRVVAGWRQVEWNRKNRDTKYAAEHAASHRSHFVSRGSLRCAEKLQSKNSFQFQLVELKVLKVDSKA